MSDIKWIALYGRFRAWLLRSLTCTVKFVDSSERRRTSANAMVKPFSTLSLKLQKRTSTWLGTNCSTGDTRKSSKQDVHRKVPVTQQVVFCFLFTCVDVIFTLWGGPVGRHWQEAVAKLSQSVADRYGRVHHWARHGPERHLWWGVHNLCKQSNIIQYRQITHSYLFPAPRVTKGAEIRQAWKS